MNSSSFYSLLRLQLERIIMTIYCTSNRVLKKLKKNPQVKLTCLELGRIREHGTIKVSFKFWFKRSSWLSLPYFPWFQSLGSESLTVITQHLAGMCFCVCVFLQMLVLCAVSDSGVCVSSGGRPWLNLCLTAYQATDDEGQNQTCYQICNTAFIRPSSTTWSEPDPAWAQVGGHPQTSVLQITVFFIYFCIIYILQRDNKCK